MGGRRLARMVAVQALYEADITGHPPLAVLARRAADAGIRKNGLAFATRLVEATIGSLEALDQRIADAAPARPLSQMDAVDRAILRLALAEISMGGDTPKQAIANEAVELAKLLGSESAPRFINGVLGTVLR
ncbi:MAG: transcription antitermination factor NusB [Chloroflexi bacterium]|nr:transcription antitermination factor NusB [Chloroflexota bacterium]